MSCQSKRQANPIHKRCIYTLASIRQFRGRVPCIHRPQVRATGIDHKRAPQAVPHLPQRACSAAKCRILVPNSRRSRVIGCLVTRDIGAKVFLGWRTNILGAADACCARRREGSYRFIQNRSRTFASGATKICRGVVGQKSTFARFSTSFDFRLLQYNPPKRGRSVSGAFDPERTSDICAPEFHLFRRWHAR